MQDRIAQGEQGAPRENAPKGTFTVEVLKRPEELWALENRFLAEIGEEPLDQEKRARLAGAMEEGQVVFFLARERGRPAGICSVSPCFSTFACRRCGVFDDFYVEPAFRGRGAARLLAEAARSWCQEQGCSGMTVGCSPGDEAMYRALGFTVRLGVMLALDL